jgi:hypothetical protein
MRCCGLAAATSGVDQRRSGRAIQEAQTPGSSDDTDQRVGLWAGRSTDTSEFTVVRSIQQPPHDDEPSDATPLPPPSSPSARFLVVPLVCRAALVSVAIVFETAARVVHARLRRGEPPRRSATIVRDDAHARGGPDDERQRFAWRLHDLDRSARDTHNTAHHATHTTHAHSRAPRSDATPVIIAALCDASSSFSRDDHFPPSSHCISCTDAGAEHIIVISMNHRIYTYNSILAAALLVMLQRRLWRFPAFALVFPPPHLLATPSVLHRS